MSANGIGNEGLLALGLAVARTSSMRDIYLSGNYGVTDEIVRRFMSMINYHPSLTSVILYRTGVSMSLQRKIEVHMETQMTRNEAIREGCLDTRIPSELGALIANFLCV